MREKILVQCDFDGTVTEEDISFMILDAFAHGDWRQLLAQYRKREITVGFFNTTAFTMVKEDSQTLNRFVQERYELRAGFGELVEFCRRRGYRFVIVSNGLDFYIRTILKTIGLDDIEIYAARTRFGKDGIEACYLGPDGKELQDDFKKEHVWEYLSEGYRIAYIGNGDSDIPSAALADYVFATGQLLDYYRAKNLDCIPFNDLNDVVKGLELMNR